MENRMYYLYHKVSPLGLNYLGITTRDPFKYSGSGLYWKNHLKFHQIKTEEIKTIIILETLNKEELIEKSRYYSELYNIVESNEWANLTPESGDNSMWGYKFSEESKKKMSESRKGLMVGEKNHMFGKITSDEVKEKIRQANTGKKLTEEQRDKISKKLKGNKSKTGQKYSQETIEKIKRNRKSTKGLSWGDHTKDSKKKLSEIRKGRGNSNYNSTPILQYDKDYILVKEWPDLFSLLECGYTYRQKKEISRACRDKITTYDGFIWKFKITESELKIENKL